MTEIRFPSVERIKGAPKIQKSGIISVCGGENSIFVRNGRLMRLENYWEGFEGYPGPCAVIFEYFSDEHYAPFGSDGARFYSCYCENDRVYAYATKDNKIFCYTSDDLINWKRSVAAEFPESFILFNTAVCKGEDCYMMAIEADGTSSENAEVNPHIGKCFTEFFAKSYDLVTWELLPFETGYTKERYNACPALKYTDGHYYMICLEELPCYRFAPYIYRTTDFVTWEIGFYNPLFTASTEDLYPKHGVILAPEEAEEQFRHLNTNNSDVDLCEFESKTYIVYASGNQGVTWGGCTCEAVFNGTLDEFLKACFS